MHGYHSGAQRVLRRAMVWLGVEVIKDHRRSVGIRVVKTFPDSPARLAGLAVHDVVLSANGTPMVTTDSLRYRLLRMAWRELPFFRYRPHVHCLSGRDPSVSCGSVHFFF